MKTVFHLRVRSFNDAEFLRILLFGALSLMISGKSLSQTAVAANSGPICAGENVGLFETGGDAVAWRWSSDGSATFNNNRIQNPVASGAVNGEIFTVIITDRNTRNASASTTVTVNPVPAPITGKVNICIGETSRLSSNTSGGSWRSGFLEIATIQPVSGQVKGVSAGTVEIFYILSTGCTATTIVTVDPVPAAPIPGIVTQPSVYQPTGSVELTGLPPGNWIINPGAIAGSGSSYTVDGLAPGSYEFTVTNNCGNVSPATIVIIEEIQAVDFKVSLPAGWSWFSVNAKHEDMSPGNLLSACASPGDYIKDQISFSIYSEKYGWYGTLNELDPGRLYKTRIQNLCEIAFTGEPIDAGTTPIELVAGWNWLGYLPQDPLPLNEALSSMSFTHLDYIKNQNASATYFEGLGWSGTLDYMSPAEGYMIKLAKPGTLVYPVTGGKKGGEEISDTNEFLFTSSGFEFNGSVTAIVFLDGIPQGSEYDLLYAFADTQVRGVARGIYFEPLDRWLYILMIHSNISEGEILEFRYYDSAGDKFYPCRETVVFSKDMIVADAYKSFEINIDTTGEDTREVKNEEPQLHIFPNPSSGDLNIEYTLNETCTVRLSVYDMSGRFITLLADQMMGPGNYSVRWNYPQESGGTFMIKLEAGFRQKIEKVILLR